MEQRIYVESIDDNPWTFWYEHRFAHPILSWLARSIYSIPATTANFERQFSASWLMISLRVNNAMFLLSVRKNEWLVIVFYFFKVHQVSNDETI